MLVSPVASQYNAATVHPSVLEAVPAAADVEAESEHAAVDSDSDRDRAAVGASARGALPHAEVTNGDADIRYRRG